MNLNFRYIALPVVVGLVALASLAIIAGDVVLLPSSAPSNSGRASHIVMFEDDVDVDRLIGQLESQYGVQTRLVYRHALKGASMIVPDRFIADVRSHEGVAVVETNSRVELMAFPEEQEVQTWMKRSGMDIGHTSANINGDDVELDVDIAILDTGVDGTHPDLNLFRAVNCTFGLEGEDPPIANGCAVVDPIDSTDFFGHGTRVAGAAAARDNGFGIVGAAPGARIWAAKVSGNDAFFGGPNSTEVAFVEAFIAAFDWVTLNSSDIEVVNTSLGINNNSAALHAAVQGTVNAGVVVFAAAGNDRRDIYGADGEFGTSDDTQPAAYPEVAAISGYVDTDGMPGGLGLPGSNGEGDDTFWIAPGTNPGEMGSGSNFSASVDPANPVLSPGGAIDFAMPAIDIVSTCVGNAPGEPIGPGSAGQLCLQNVDLLGGHYGAAGGTSFASPQAAGLAALLISQKAGLPGDFDDDSDVDADDVYGWRQTLIDLAVAQDNSVSGLVQPAPGDTDGNPDPLGSAGMVLNFDITSFTLADTGASQQVTVDTTYVPVAPVEIVQLNLIHDVAKFTIANPLCVGVYAGGTPIAPTPNAGGTGTIIGCTLVGGPVGDGGTVLTFDVVAAANGTQTFTLDGGGVPEGSGFVYDGRVMFNANSPTFNIDFSADILGSFDLQSVTDPSALTLIAPTATAQPVSGAASSDVLGQYDPVTGTFSITVTESGTYDLLAEASGFIPRLHKTVTVGADGVVSGVPVPTTLHGGDIEGNGVVDGSDATNWLLSFGATPANRQDGSGNIVDINGDGIVDAIDLSVLISNFGLAPPLGAEDWAP